MDYFWKFQRASLCLLLVLALPESAFGQRQALSTPSTLSPLLNEKVEILPTKDHHFNLEAPQKCGSADSSLDPSARKVICQFHKKGDYEITVSVCDNAKKYCKQEYHKVQVQGKSSGVSKISVPPRDQTLEAQKKMKKLVMSGFQVLEPEEAKSQSSGKKGILVMSSTDWCPPCNMSKEFLFSNGSFSNLVNDFLLVYVDGDSPLSHVWTPYLKSYYYPSFVLMNQNLEVLGLYSGYASFKEFGKWLNSSLQSGETLASLETRVNERMSGGIISTIKNFFVTDSQKKLEAEKLNEWYQNRSMSESSEKLKKSWEHLVSSWDKAYQAFEKLTAIEKPTKEEEQRMLQLQEKLFNSHETNDQFPYYEVMTYCKNDQSPEWTQSKCQKYSENAVAYLKRSLKKDWGDLTAAERALNSAATARYILQVRSAASSQVTSSSASSSTPPSTSLSELSRICEMAYKGLMRFSPLKEKSRVARMGLAGCYIEKGIYQGVRAEKVLLSLINDFPYEETFYRTLASLKKKKKQFQQSLDYNSKALKYAYGIQWLRNIHQRVEILKTMGESQRALALIDKNLKEIEVTGSHRESRWLKRIRKSHEDLKKALGKSAEYRSSFREMIILKSIIATT